MTATESNEAPIISIQNVWKFFGQLTALHDVSFDVQPGERVVIIGPSGSGKSTLLRSINRLEVIDKGTILVEGSDINAPENDINKIRQDLGMVFQSFNLFPHKTVLQNLTMAPMKLRHISKHEAESALSSCSRKWGCPKRSTSTRVCFPAASNSASPLPAPSPCSPTSCCSTNLRPRSILK